MRVLSHGYHVRGQARVMAALVLAAWAWNSMLACSTDPDPGLPGDADNRPGDAGASPDAGNPGDGGSPGAEGRASIVFPPPVGLSEAENRIIVVRGTATASHGVATVRVNGIGARTSNGFADWQAEVPLAPGSNVLTVEVEDLQGTRFADVARTTVVLSAVLRLPTAAALDPISGHIIVAEYGLAALSAIDPGSGARTVLASTSVGSGPWLEPEGSDLRALAIDMMLGQALLVDADTEQLLAVDLATGKRWVVSSNDQSPALRDAVSMVTDTAHGRVLVLADDQLVAVNLASGQRSVVSGQGVGQGQMLRAPVAVAMDPDHQRALIADEELLALVAVDLASGDRVVLSSEDTGTGAPLWYATSLALAPRSARALVGNSLGDVIAVDLASGMRTLLAYDLGRPTAITMDATGTRAVIADLQRDTLVSMDPATGAWEPLAPVRIGSGMRMPYPHAVVLDDAGQRALIADRQLGAVLGVDLTTGDRTVLSHTTLGNGPALVWPLSLALDAAHDRALVINNDGSGALLAVDLASGDRTVLADSGTGQGPLLSPTAIAWDSMGGRVLALAADREPALLAVDPETGDRSVISGSTTGTGPGFEQPRAIAVDTANQRAVILDEHAVMAVDLRTGDRVILSDDTTGSGPRLEDTDAMALDLAHGRALVVLQDGTEILAVDLATGERTLLARHTMATGMPDETVARFGAIATDARYGHALVTDSGLDALVAVDLGGLGGLGGSGELTASHRVIVSR